jgi:hypothetical protein
MVGGQPSRDNLGEKSKRVNKSAPPAGKRQAVLISLEVRRTFSLLRHLVYSEWPILSGWVTRCTLNDGRLNVHRTVGGIRTACLAVH